MTSPLHTICPEPPIALRAQIRILAPAFKSCSTLFPAEFLTFLGVLGFAHTSPSAGSTLSTLVTPIHSFHKSESSPTDTVLELGPSREEDRWRATTPLGPVTHLGLRCRLLWKPSVMERLKASLGQDEFSQGWHACWGRILPLTVGSFYTQLFPLLQSPYLHWLLSVPLTQG